jgi:TolA-binding protein
MKIRTLLFGSLTFLVLIGCAGNAEKKKMLDRIEASEAKIFGDSLRAIPDQNTGMEMIQAYTDYANTYPDDTASAEYLYKGAEIAMNMKMSALAIEYYKRIAIGYPSYSKVPYCIFLQAFILENQLNQFDQAKAVYREFLDKYPDHVLARDARLSIENMGKPIEDLIREWESRSQE